jgi:predicted signal transduction protein with EAL and GGDEF domain
MPLEIRELIIKVRVEENVGKQQIEVKELLHSLKAQLVNECIDKLLLKLENVSER